MKISRGFIFSLRREIYRMKLYGNVTLMIIMLPILAFAFLSVLFYNGVPRDLPIAVMDEDNTSLSRKVLNMVDAGAFVNTAYQIQSLEEGRDMMFRGDINAILVIPEGFEKDILSNTQAKTPLFINGVNLLKASLIEKDVVTTIQTFSTGTEIQKLMTSGISQPQAYDMSMPVYFEKHILFNPYTSYAYYLLPGFMPMMLLTFIILGTVFSIGIELKKGTASMWVSSAGGSITRAVLAKFAPYTLIYLILSLLMNIIMYRVIGVPLNGSVGMLVASNIIFVLSYQWVALIIITILSNMRLALSVGAGYSVLAFSFSGLTFPFIAMNQWVALFGKIFPFTYYMDIFISQSMRGGTPVVNDLNNIGAMLIFILVAMLFLGRLKNICMHPEYWYKD